MPAKKQVTKTVNKDAFKSSADKNSDGHLSRSEGNATRVGDLNHDGRVTRLERKNLLASGKLDAEYFVKLNQKNKEVQISKAKWAH
jgi:hypothetical protein